MSDFPDLVQEMLDEVLGDDAPSRASYLPLKTGLDPQNSGDRAIHDHLNDVFGKAMLPAPVSKPAPPRP